MALIEVTSKTALLQNKIQAALNDSGAGVEFVTDAESVEDARQKVLESYQRACGSLDKAARVAQKTNQTEIPDLLILSIKCLAEHFVGNDIFRWSDTIKVHMDKDYFFAHVKNAISIKKDAYLSALAITDGMLTLRSDAIQPHRVTEFELLPLNVNVKVIDNKTSWPDYLKGFEEMLKRLMRTRKPPRKSVDKIRDIYHLHSLYDAEIDELWLCKRGFASRYLKYLRAQPTYAEILKKVKLERL
jgi:hypothetical protein